MSSQQVHSSGPELPTEASVVVIGGGVIGCSVAYHLAQLGWQDVVLLERAQLTSGTTWHAAGLIAQLRATQNMTRLAKYSADLYGRLEAETGVATGFKQPGSLGLALSSARLEEFTRNAAMATYLDVEAHMVGPAECAELYPDVDLKGVKGGIWLPQDGQADPVNITMALASGARARGVRIFEGVAATRVDVAGDRVRSVATSRGVIATPYVVNCAGMWARTVGKMANVDVPLHAAEHFYIVTEPVPGLGRRPVLRVPDEQAYYKEDAGKILLGAFELKAKPWGMDGISDDFSFTELPPDLDHFQPILEQAVQRMPQLAHVGIQTFFNGPESFTPDDRYLLGEAPDVQGFFVAAGFNSVGIQSAGGAGRALAQWLDGGAPPFDLWDVDIRRMSRMQNNARYLYERTTETLGLLYADHFPFRQYATARGVRRTPLHDRLERAGACFGELAGWERPNWFDLDAAARGVAPAYEYSWQRQNWFDRSAQEHRAVRNGVGLFDLSGFGKFRVLGADACAVLQRICANDIDVATGRLVYTQWLNERGTIEADLTVARLSKDEFLVTTSAACAVRDLSWLRRHIPAEAHCAVVDVTAAEATIAVMGPQARELLERVTPAALDNAAFAFGSVQEIEVGMALARAHRVTYVGELGWELYVSADQAVHVFDALVAAADGLDFRLCGMHALDSCRLEKGYRHFGHDITDEDGPLEAGLSFAVKPDKPVAQFGRFIGCDAFETMREQGPQRRLLQFLLQDPEALLFHNEPVLRDGEVVGLITSAAYGHSIGGAIGMAYVPRRAGESLRQMLASEYSIDVAGTLIPAKVSSRPWYDPKSARVHS